MSGKLTEPKVITDFEQQVVCILPVGFYFDDERWDKIWQLYDEKGRYINMNDLKQLFPDEPTVQNGTHVDGEEGHDWCGHGHKPGEGHHHD